MVQFHEYSFIYKPIHMYSIKKVAVTVLVTAVTLLTLLALLSIWDVLAKDIFGKSLSSIGVIAFGALVIIIAVQTLEKKSVPKELNQ